MLPSPQHFEDFAVVWYDQNILNEENLSYQKIHLSRYYHNYCFNDLNQASNKIKQLSDKSVLVISSGRGGQLFVDTIKDYKNLIGVIIFTRNPQNHQWVNSYPKTIILISKIASQVFNQVQKIAIDHNKNHNKQQKNQLFDLYMDSGIPVIIPNQNLSNYQQSKELYEDFIQRQKQQSIQKLCHSKSNQKLLYYLKSSFVNEKKKQKSNNHPQSNMLYKQIVQESKLNNPKTASWIMEYLLSIDFKSYQVTHALSSLKHLKSPQFFVKAFCCLFCGRTICKKLMEEQHQFVCLQLIQELVLGLTLLTKNTKFQIIPCSSSKLFCQNGKIKQKQQHHALTWQHFMSAFKQANRIPKVPIYQIKLHQHRKTNLCIQWPAMYEKLGNKQTEQILIFPHFRFEKKQVFYFEGRQITRIEQIVSSH